MYDEDVDGFTFSKNKRSKPAAKANGVRNSAADKTSPVKPPPAPPAEEPEPKATTKKPRKRFPTTPEREAAEKPARRSKRLSDENEPDKGASPHKAAHAKSHKNHERSLSPPQITRPVTVEKKRRRGQDGVEEEKIMRIQLPFADTPVIKRNKEMRKASAENGQRRSSSGMRGRRASSLIDEGRGNGEFDLVSFTTGPSSRHLAYLNLETAASPAAAARQRHQAGSEPKKSNTRVIGLSTPPSSETVAADSSRSSDSDERSQNIIADDPIFDAALPHSEVPSSEFYKHISAELTEPRRMRCLLGWCGTRALPSKPEPPKENTAASNLEFQAQQAGKSSMSKQTRKQILTPSSARIIQEELSQDLVTKGTLSDWFSRDESVPPQIPLRKKPNPRNVANAAKAAELERELER